MINRASLKNENDFLITPGEGLGVVKSISWKDILKTRYWSTDVTDAKPLVTVPITRPLNELLRKGVSSPRAEQSWKPEGLTLRTLHCISLSPFWDCKEQISLGHVQGGSVQFILSVEFDSLRSHESQHARPPCPLLTPGVYSNPCPLSRWCHPTISPSVAPFSSCPQSFPTSGSFLMSQLYASGGQSIGVSASTSVFAMNTQDWSPLGWTGWISLLSKGLSRFFFKHQFFDVQLSL